MTRFWRDGFYRTSLYGNTHWVEGHWVERDDWDRSNSATSLTTLYREYLKVLRVERSATACLVVPNADCPVCGDPVFFYQNEFGSKVYFDELGPPWPKHSCMEHSNSNAARFNMNAKEIHPEARSSSQIKQIESLEEYAEIDLSYEFWKRYRTSQWEAWRIEGRFRGGATLLVLSSVDAGKPRRRFVSASRLPKCLQSGVVIFINKGWISYYDFQSMVVDKTEVRKIRTSGAFVDELVRKQRDISS